MENDVKPSAIAFARAAGFVIDEIGDYRFVRYIPPDAFEKFVEVVTKHEEAESYRSLELAYDELNCAETELEVLSLEFADERFNQGFTCLGDYIRAIGEAYREKINHAYDAGYKNGVAGL